MLGQQYLKNGKDKHGLYDKVFKKIFNKLSNGMQVDKLCLVVLKLLTFKVCRIISISKIECFNFSGTDRVN